MASPSRSRGNVLDPSVLHPDTSTASGESELAALPLPHPSASAPAKQASTVHRPRTSSLSNRSRALSSASATSSSSVRRKPLPSTASPLATRFSPAEPLPTAVEAPEKPFARNHSIDSPTLYEFPLNSTTPFTPARSLTSSSAKALPGQASLTSTSTPEPQTAQHDGPTHHVLGLNNPNLTLPFPVRPTIAHEVKHARLTSDSALTSGSRTPGPWSSASSTTSLTYSAMSMFSTKPTPPHKITLPNALSRSFSKDSTDSNNTLNKPLPKSPGASKLGSFFGWGSNASPASPTTTFSEKSYSPIPSPHSEAKPGLANTSRTHTSKITPTAIDIPRANAEAGSYFGSAYLPLPLATPTSPIQVEEMEKELKDISSELAGSIRREMELEDLVERLQAEAQNPSAPGKRTSDYFSDSGTSSVKYGSDSESKQDELDRMLRKTEQEKAQMRLELTNKVQDERAMRKQLEKQIRTLEEKASHVDLASMNSQDANGRLRDLEATCEDLRRRLAEEKQVKDNFEDLLTALKGELQNSHNERDNLRDEIVPQLRARVEGLEAQAAQHEKLTYEQTKMQQELQALKNENLTLIKARGSQQDMQQEVNKFNSIAEEGAMTALRNPQGLMRSSSVVQPNSRSRPQSLTRSTSMKVTESRESLAERVKDIELQRDALHRALKSLLERQEHENRENKKRIRQLEMERDRALSNSPKRLGYDKEVANLREEINTLRRRADEAMEQKWQCEKGLSGLKMDLDRAEQEIGSLRTLLQGNEILPRLVDSKGRPISASSETLERSYRDLQAAYAESLEQIKRLELSGPKDEKTERAVKQLEQSLADAISERDFAKQEAEGLRQQQASLRDSERKHLSDELTFAEELRGSAKRVEELATQVRQQLASNATLRQRLSETIERGEKEQKANAQKIMFMQSKLKSLEDQLVAAQQLSEERIAKHEEEVRNLKESHNEQLQRMKEGLRSPRMFAAKAPMSPMLANSAKAPRILSTSSGKAMTVSEDSNMEGLKQRVVELEKALADADSEMEEVVGRMNIAQIEVMELQNEREEAVRETKRLQRLVDEERLKTFEGRFATLSSPK